jgi:multidrug efflux system outer membrane protein
MKINGFIKQPTTYLLTGILTAVSSCKVSRDIPKPLDILPASYRGSQPSYTTSVASLPLGEFLQESYLKVLIDTALIRNNDLQIAIRNIDAAQKLLKQARVGQLPTINLAVTGTTSRPSDNSLNGLTLSQFLDSKHIEDYSAAVALSWEADIWGKVRNQKSDALAAFLQTTEARKAIQTQLVSDISRGYYNLLMLDAQVRIARENVALNDSTLRIIQLQYDAGQVTSLAVQQAQAQQLAAAQLVPRFEQEITVQENAVSLLVGKVPGPVQRAASLDQFFPLKHISAGIPAALLNMRPDVKSAELEIDRSNARVGLNKANMYPSLTITAQGGVNSFRASNWFTLPASLFGNAMGNLTQPLFQKRRLRTQYELAVIEREKSVIIFRQQVLTAVGEVSDALVRIDKLAQQRSVADQRTETLKQATTNAGLLFRNGMANYLEVITAQSNVLQSQLQSAELKRAQLDASVELYRSVGGGWK